jgi:hypothetical protein
MGSNPYREKSPNRNMGREMGRKDEDEDDASQDVNIQEIASDPRPAPSGLGTNFSHVRKEEDDDETAS